MSDLDFALPQSRRGMSSNLKRSPSPVDELCKVTAERSQESSGSDMLRVTALRSNDGVSGCLSVIVDDATTSFPSNGESRHANWDSSCDDATTKGIHCTDGRVSITDANSSSGAQSSAISQLPGSVDLNAVFTLPAGWPSTLRNREGIGSSSSIHKEIGLLKSDVLHPDEGGQVEFEHEDQSVYPSDEVSRPRRSRFESLANYQLSELSQPGFFTSHSFMLNPTGAGRLIFDFVGVGVLFGDLTLIPYLLAWDIENSLFLDILSIVTAAFWTFDIFVNFLTGFTHHGDLELSPSAVAKKYLATWFFMDAALVCFDWITLLFSSMTSSLKMARFAKMGRFLRIASLVRMVRLTRVSDSLGYRSLSEGYRLVVNVCTILFAILWCSHFIACAWYLLGRRVDSDTGVTWVDAIPFDDPLYKNAGIFYQYTTSLHWSIAQVTLGAIEISASNSFERMFNVSCLLVGLLVSSTLASSLSAAMINFQMRLSDQKTKMRLVESFLRQYKVDRSIAVRVKQHILERLDEKEMLTDKDVPTLKLLSSSMGAELRAHIYKPYLMRHPLFRLWTNLSNRVTMLLCDQAVLVSILQPNDDLFVAGTETDEAYYVVAGTLSYVQHPESSAVPHKIDRDVGESSWISEAAIWSQWFHVGSAVATTTCKLLIVSHITMFPILRKHRVIEELARCYRDCYHKRVIAAKPPKLEWPTDLYVPFSEYEDIVSSMDRELQRVVGYNALVTFKQNASGAKFLWGQEVFRDLQSEVLNGSSILLVSGTGEVQQHIFWMSLQIENKGGLVLALLGRRVGTEVRADCMLPGAQLRQGERRSDAARRILEEQLSRSGMDVTVKSFDKVSGSGRPEFKMGCAVSYMRTICIARATKGPTIQGRRPALVAGRSLAGEYQMRTVFGVERKDETLFYAWLRTTELERFKSPENETQLREWLHAVNHASAEVIDHHEEDEDEDEEDEDYEDSDDSTSPTSSMQPHGWRRVCV